MFGTANLTADIEKKIKVVNELTELAFLCLEVCVWYVAILMVIWDMDSIKRMLSTTHFEEVRNFIAKY